MSCEWCMAWRERYHCMYVSMFNPLLTLWGQFIYVTLSPDFPVEQHSIFSSMIPRTSALHHTPNGQVKVQPVLPRVSMLGPPPHMNMQRRMTRNTTGVTFIFRTSLQTLHPCNLPCDMRDSLYSKSEDLYMASTLLTFYRHALKSTD